MINKRDTKLLLEILEEEAIKYCKDGTLCLKAVDIFYDMYEINTSKPIYCAPLYEWRTVAKALDCEVVTA